MLKLGSRYALLCAFCNSTAFLEIWVWFLQKKTKPRLSSHSFKMTRVYLSK